MRSARRVFGRGGLQCVLSGGEREMGSRRRAVEDDERVEVDKARRQGFSASVVRLRCWLREESVRRGVD